MKILFFLPEQEDSSPFFCACIIKNKAKQNKNKRTNKKTTNKSRTTQNSQLSLWRYLNSKEKCGACEHKQSFVLEISLDFYILQRIFFCSLWPDNREIFAPDSSCITYVCLEMFHCTVGSHYTLRAAIIRLSLSYAELPWNPMISGILFHKEIHTLPVNGKMLLSGSSSLYFSPAHVSAGDIITDCWGGKVCKRKGRKNQFSLEVWAWESASVNCYLILDLGKYT